MTAQPRILVLGYNAWDVRLPVAEIPARDTKCEVARIGSGGGGPGANAAVALARLGAGVRLVTQLGDDLPGEMQRRELSAAGVDLSLSQTVSGHESPKAVILVRPDSGERTIFWTRGDLPLLTADQIRTDWLEDTDLFYTDGHENRAALVLAKEARRRGLPTVLDAGTVRAGAAELLAVVSDAISSEGFAPALTGCERPDDALRRLRDRGPQQVAMTFGVHGVLALVGDAIRHVPAFEVTVTDTTGAGDAFHAGYAYARSTGRGFLASLEFGSATAALKCRAWGGRQGLPSLRAVSDLLRDGARRPPPFAFGALLG